MFDNPDPVPNQTRLDWGPQQSDGPLFGQMPVLFPCDLLEVFQRIVAFICVYMMDVKSLTPTMKTLVHEPMLQNTLLLAIGPET